MIQEELVFDKVKDLFDVDQFGYVNLSEALTTGVVDSSLKIEESLFNGIDDPASIIGKPRDVFEAYRMAHQVASRGMVNHDTPPS